MSAIAARVRDAFESSTPLRIRGAGLWLDAGRPSAGAALSLADHRGIVEYVPGDLTLTARAGTPIGELVAAVKEHDQWLPLDPWGGDSGTLGATISTATAGPHAHGMGGGLPRDVVLGMEFVSGSGEVIRAGGRVVKNVAGFDLTRLLVGSWGTLGVVTEVTVRLRARPQHTRTMAIDMPTSRQALNELGPKLRALPFTPLAAELVNAALAFELGVGEMPALLVRVGGNDRSVRGQLELLRPFGNAREFESRVWTALRTIEPPAGTSATWRWSQLPTLFGNNWSAAERSTSGLDRPFIHGSPARGIVRVVTRQGAGSSPQNLATAITDFSGTLCIERLPLESWPFVQRRPTRDDLGAAIRTKFDPRGILNAGILGESA